MVNLLFYFIGLCNRFNLSNSNISFGSGKSIQLSIFVLMVICYHNMPAQQFGFLEPANTYLFNEAYTVEPLPSKLQSDSSKNKSSKKPEIGGVIQVHFLEQFNTNGDTIDDPAGFRILRARLEVKGIINDFTTYEIMIDPRAPENTGILRDAFIAFDLGINQSLRVGQQKTQFGFENRESSNRLYFVNRTEMSDNLSRGANLRDIGLGLIGDIKINDKWRFENAITFTNGSKINVAGPWEFSKVKNTWARAGLRYKTKDITIWTGLSGGKGGYTDVGNLLTDPVDDAFIKFERYGVDVEVDNKFIFFASEYVGGKEVINDTISYPFGYYGILAAKTKYKIGPAIRYDVLDDEWKRWTLCAYYGLPKDKLRLMVNYEFRGYIAPETLYGHDDRLYIQLQVVF